MALWANTILKSGVSLLCNRPGFRASGLSDVWMPPLKNTAARMLNHEVRGRQCFIRIDYREDLPGHRDFPDLPDIQ